MLHNIKVSQLMVTFAGLVITGLALPAYAASFGSGVISDITIESDTFARISVGTTAITGRPACHNSSYTVHYAFDISTSEGKAILSDATAAMLAGKTVAATGTGTCLTSGSGLSLEKVIYFTVYK